MGRFASLDGVRFPRRTRVVCRSPRGLEIGEVLSAEIDSTCELDGSVLRPVSDTDELLLARLERHKREAFEACQRLLKERGLNAVLVDVEHLFDGQSLYFYFLGEVTTELEQITAELTEVYDAEVQFRRFAQTLEVGCGPGCGTEEGGAGCGTGGCSSCAVASACHPRRR